MEEVKINNKVIQKNDTSFPEHFDFEWLRSRGLEHIGQLSGKIWTDHNTHDPGITMLELLCYALIDLGYRTKLPIEDLLAKKKDEEEDNFFTPAEILTCNPTTILDYRKMLMDIDGVQNAWLEVVKDECLYLDCEPMIDENGNPIYLNCTKGTDLVKIPLNGLYRVYIELENEDPYCLNKIADLSGDLEDGIIEEPENPIITEVKKRLSRYRNLCEDFLEIHTLCPEEIGLCAEIELSDTANPEKVYIDVMEAVNRFLTPEITYYTLQDFLDKGKTIEEAFEGRPYLADQQEIGECGEAIIESRGFIDKEELKNIKRHKTIHLSDIYKLILEIDGVASIKNLVLTGWIDDERVESSSNVSTLEQEEDEARCWNWELPLHKNYVPQLCFEHTCLNLHKGGSSYAVDQDKIEQQLRSSIIAGNAPLLSEDNLNIAIPTGNYRPDLGDYYSIQNDLPNVYGVGEGGIPDSATDLRKAQALQLKGYLLFYDQLLATYINQVGNLRNLFSLKPDSKRPAEVLHTYFPQMMDSVPQAGKLIQFYDKENNGLLDGTVLGLPAETEPTNLQLEELKQQKDFEFNIKQYYFDKVIDRDIALSQLQREFGQGDITTTICEDECGFFFVIRTRFTEYVLTSRKHYDTHNEAKSAAESVSFLGALPKAYQKAKTTIDDNGTTIEKYTFSIVYQDLGYLTILQNMVENETAYCERREAFLNHLLSRFSENFNEYALLNYTLGLDDKKRIERKGQFLSNYPEISRNRGQAYDYCEPVWRTNNRSGLENKIAALTGLGEMKNPLCNFEVYCPQGSKSGIRITDTKGNVILESDCTFENEEKALRFLTTLFSKCMFDKANYKDVNKKGAYSFYIQCEKCKVYYTAQFIDKKERDAVKKSIYSHFVHNPDDKDIFASEFEGEKPVKWKYYCWWRNEGTSSIPIFQSVKSYKTKEEAIKAYQTDCKKIAKANLKIEDGIGRIYLSGRKNASLESYRGKPSDYDVDDLRQEFEFYKKLLCADVAEYRKYLDDLIGTEAKFRILKKDPIAIYPCACFDENEDDLEEEMERLCANIAAGYKILEICLAGDICIKIDDKYHYVIRDKNTEEIYLISYEGYPTAEEAIAAFNENYLQVIDLASNVENYTETTDNQDSTIPAKWAIGVQGKVAPLACVSEDLKLNEQQLADCFCTYPIRIKKETEGFCCDNNGPKVSYYFQLVNPNPPQPTEDGEICKEDWKSTQCYKTPEEAMKAFTYFLYLLKNKENIRLIPQEKIDCCFEKEENCTCKSYISVIEILVESCQIFEDEEDVYSSKKLAWEGLNNFIQCANNIENYVLDDSNGCYTFQIWDNGGGQANLLEEECQEYQIGLADSSEEGNMKLAEHPLCYECISEAIDAIRRLLNCINQEGMHLVEHILLRPDCDPSAEINNCLIQPTEVDCCCKLEYELEAGEACTDDNNIEKTITYIPGADTYSFWATVVLPGWTSSFSTHNQRDLFQELLYKNTPAHIGLNIVWISPEQMCEFEDKYTQWLQSLQLGADNTCFDDVDVQCEMVECLSTLSDYTPKPKEDAETMEEGCTCTEEEGSKVGLNKNKLIVNYQFSGDANLPSSKDMNTVLHASGNSNFAHLPISLSRAVATFQKDAVKAASRTLEKKSISAKKPVKAKQSKFPDFLIKRKKRYIANLENIKDKVMKEERVMYKDALAYLKGGKTDFGAYEYVAERILQYGQKTGGVETDLFFYLLCNATWCYLDISVWQDNRNIQHLAKWKALINRMKEDGINTAKLLRGWNAKEPKVQLNAKSVGKYYRMIR